MTTQPRYFTSILLLLLCFSVNVIAQQVTILDANFEQQLIDLNIDTDGIVNKQVAAKDVKKIKHLDLSIEEFSSDDKKIKDLTGIEGFKNLEVLRFSWHSLKSFDATLNKKLIELIAVGNNLSSITLHKNKQLRLLNLRENRLIDIDVSANKKLETLHLGTNKIQHIYLEKNKALHTLFIQENNLEGLEIFNNKNIQTLNVKNNPKLACINVDEENSIQKVVKDEFQILAKFCNFIIAQEAKREIVLIHDINFEIALQALGYDLDYEINGQINVEDALRVDILALNDKKIKDLTGIEAFENLRFLAIHNNEISTLNIRNNKQLESLWASNNQLRTIDLSENILLKHLVVDHNHLVELDISANVNMEVLEVQHNFLNHLDISKNGKLTKFLAEENPLMSITDSTIYEAIRGNYTKKYIVKANTFPTLKTTKAHQDEIKDQNEDAFDLDNLLDEIAYIPSCKDEADKQKCTSTGLQKIIANNFNYDLARVLKAKDNRFRMNLYFDIDKNGNLKNPRVFSVHKKLIDETIRMSTLFPQFVPAKKNGENKKSHYAIPVVVQLIE